MLELNALVLEEGKRLDDSWRGEFYHFGAERGGQLLDQMLLLNERVEVFAVVFEETLDAHSCLGR